MRALVTAVLLLISMRHTAFLHHLAVLYGQQRTCFRGRLLYKVNVMLDSSHPSDQPSCHCMLIFRRLGPEDSTSMHELEKRCFTQPWTEKQCRAAFEQKAFVALGLLQEQKLVAYVSFYHSVDDLEILNLAVCPEKRRSGIGRRMLNQVLQVAAKMDIQRVLLEVRRGNHPAIMLYESCGFRPAGVRLCYYSDTKEDALIYFLDLHN